ncbi:ATP-dependent Zn protease [Flavobacterium sp. CG_9.1]|nr:ATP-dependent Zn protease [Flavobacterium sp. CG_9.1]
MKITRLRIISLILFATVIVLITVDKFNFLKSFLLIIAFGLLVIDSQKNNKIKNSIIVSKNNKVKPSILLSFLVFILFFIIFYFYKRV